MDHCLNETSLVLSNQQIPLPSVSHNPNSLNDSTFIKPDPDEIEYNLNKTSQGVESQKMALPSALLSNEVYGLKDSTCIKPDPDEFEYNVNKTSQGVANQQIPFLSALKYEVKEEIMHCQFCPCSDVDFDKLKFHTFTQHSTGAAVMKFSESDHDIKFFCVKETCNFSTTMCSVYEEHLMKCCLLHQTLSEKEKKRLESTLQFVFDFHSEHCSSDVTKFFEYFSSFNKTYTSVQFRKHKEHNDLFSVVSRSSEVLSSMVCEDVGERNIEDPFSSVTNPVPVFIVQNQNTNLIESQKINSENVLTSVGKQNKHNGLLQMTDPSVTKMNKSKIHTNMKTEIVKTPFSCVNCGKCFRYRSDFLRHVRTHSGEKPFKCEECNKAFSQLHSLITHNRLHTGEKPFKCDMCHKAFIKSCYLITHRRTHTGEKPYKCDVCGKYFTSSGNLIGHKRTHTGEKPFKCNLCDKNFTRSRGLMLHKSTHTREKSFKCDVCDNQFAKSTDLSAHKRTHTGEKPYKCDACDNQFARSSDLIAHKRTHTGEKPYKCNVCDKEFARSSDLVVHKRTHTGEKPFKCDVCDKKFSSCGNLIVHKRTHTGEKPFTCDLCDKKFTYSRKFIAHKRTHLG